MTDRRRIARGQKCFTSGRWSILLALVVLLSGSLGCSLGGRLDRLAQIVVDGPRHVAVAQSPVLATYTPWPTFTPTRSSLPSPTPTATWLPWPTPTATDTPVPSPTALATATFTPLPSATPWPTDTPVPARPSATPAPTSVAVASSTATPTPAPTPTPGYDYLVNEVYVDRTTVPFLTGYIAIVNAQDIPIGGVKAVGVFEPGGQRHESPLSKWFFDVATAPGAAAKTGSVKFEPGGIQAGTWLIHLEDEWGTRLSEDVAISTRPDNPEWFFVKFRQSGPVVAVASAPMPTVLPSVAASTTGDASVASTGGWSFVGVKSVYDPDWESLFLRGEAVNDTGAPQRLTDIIGIFYDADGQVIADRGDFVSYWPTDVVPAGGLVPFEVEIYDVREVADFDLKVIAQATGETVREDFDITNLEVTNRPGEYCVTGELRNPGGGLRDYLVIAAVLYDDQGRVINYGSYNVWYPPEVAGDQGADFELCADLLDQAVARYVVRAWGQ